MLIKRLLHAYGERTAVRLAAKDDHISCLLYTSKPLVLKGTDLNQTAGISDYTGLIAIDESAAYYGMFAYTDDYVLNKGTYTIRPEYSNTSSDNIIEVWDNGTKVAQWSLESTDGVKTTRDYTFTLDKDSQQLHIRIYYQGVGSLILNLSLIHI